MEEKVYCFANRQDFDSKIKKIDISVPLRIEGRKTEHTESYSIVSFLKNFIDSQLFHFPIRVIHRDKPDFYIEIPNKKIGVEFTESIPQQLAYATALLEEHFPNGQLEPEFFGWDAPERSKDEILEILAKSKERLIGEGSFGDSVEEQWLLGIYGCILNKTKKLNNSNFTKFEQNWLLIYDNQLKAFLNKDYVSNKIKSILDEYWTDSKEIKFSRIFIESGDYFFNLSSDLGNSLTFQPRSF